MGGSGGVGDGHNVATYGFDLSTCLVPRDQIVAAGLPKDGLPALIDPSTVAAATLEPHAKLSGIRKLLPDDRVIGVVVDGRARAYPLWILAWHEIANDTLGDRPIAVTYSPLCDSAVVFDRRFGAETLEFHVSGLLYNSNLLMYDQHPDGRGESLWSQLQFRAVAGPAAEEGRTLELIPASLVSWGTWLERHPDTSVLLPDERRARVYKNDPYRGYFANSELHFPVDPLPPGDSYPLKTRIAARRTTAGWDVSVAEESEGSTDGLTIYAFWFAWYASHPETVIHQP